MADRRSCLYFYGQTPGGAATCDPQHPPAYENRAAFEEYRYDALGRRVLVRTRSEYACTQYCLNTLRRQIWDGDQLLYEISAPGGSTATATQMEADTGLAVPFFLNQTRTAIAGFFPYGRVMYEHGAGIDAPLGVVRMEYSSELHDAQVIVAHADWRGSYDRGTTIFGSCVVYSSSGTQLAPPPDSTPTNPDQYGGVAGGGSYSGTKEHCIDVDWPATYTYSALQYRRGYNGPDSWMGSLIFNQRDASGLYYRRNRYYDSDKGRFTQEDPLGLAGGVNVYGFANGDPITYADPFGLCPLYIPPGSGVCVAIDAYKAHGFRGVVNEAVGVTPGLGDLSDLVVAATGHNLITGEQVGRGGRALALLGSAVPIASSSAIRAIGREAGSTERLVIGKLADLIHGVGAGERTLLPEMVHDLGTPRLNWGRNAGLLRREMRAGMPIRDATVDEAGNLINNTGFLRAERNLLQTHGWTYDRASRLWFPPQ